ncbi:MAG: DUF350 domain-containing protein [Polyangiales bacterium]
MHQALFVVGVAKLIFGVLVGAFGVYFALRVVGKVLREEDTEKQLAKGNAAVGILQAACLISLGLLVSPAVQATFDAMDLLYRGQAIAPGMLGRFTLYAFLHVGTALIVGAGVVTLGTFLFNRFTKDVDEMEEVRKGNIAPALTLGAVLIVMALMSGPGLRTVLDGLLPLPELPRDSLPMPS